MSDPFKHVTEPNSGDHAAAKPAMCTLGGWEVAGRFSDMRIAMAMDKQNTGYDWFANRVEGREAFGKLEKSLTDANFKSPYSDDALSKVRTALCTEPYNPKAVEGVVRETVDNQVKGLNLSTNPVLAGTQNDDIGKLTAADGDIKKAGLIKTGLNAGM